MEGLLVDMQERAFDRLYEKLTRERRQEMSREEYIRYNAAGFEKLEALGGVLEDWRIDDAEDGTGTDELESAASVRVLFPARGGASEHRRRLVFRLRLEAGAWRFDSFTSEAIP